MIPPNSCHQTLSISRLQGDFKERRGSYGAALVSSKIWRSFSCLGSGRCWRCFSREFCRTWLVGRTGEMGVSSIMVARSSAIVWMIKVSESLLWWLIIMFCKMVLCSQDAGELWGDFCLPSNLLAYSGRKGGNITEYDSARGTRILGY